MGSGEYDVFLSYARSDGDAAAELNGWLSAQGIKTFFDRKELSPGLRWVPALEDAIGRSKAVAILVGAHGLGNTQQYERELALVRQTGDQTFPVIPVLMPGCDSPPTGFLQLLTWVDLSKGPSVLRQSEQPRRSPRRAARRGGRQPAIRASICPYRGLEPFREEDAAFFCGRDDAIREIVARVQEHSFVAVVGASGSGKSSLVFAGLMPALRRQGRTAMWDVVTLRPGKSPLRALAEAFGTPPENAGRARDRRMAREGGGLPSRRRRQDARARRRTPPRFRARKARPPPDLCRSVGGALRHGAAAGGQGAPCPAFGRRREIHRAPGRGGVRAGIAGERRDDGPGGLLQSAHPQSAARGAFAEAAGQYPADEAATTCASAIETPARTAGLSFAPPELVDRILDDVGLEEGRLPLLQFALKETWAKREGDKLTAEAYTEVGGVAGAIEKTAQDAYERLTLSQKDAARRLFLRLVTPGEGQADTRARSAIPDDPSSATSSVCSPIPRRGSW